MSEPGEIDRLAEIAAPRVGVITNAFPAHLESMGSVEAVAAAKGELFLQASGRRLRGIQRRRSPHQPFAAAFRGETPLVRPGRGRGQRQRYREPGDGRARHLS